MRTDLLDAARPPCPICRLAGRPAAALTAGTHWRSADGRMLEGLLACPAPACEASYPVVDGIPVIRADATTFVSDALALIMRRHDLAPGLAHLLDECAGATTGQDAARQHAATYGWDGYADDPAAGGVLRVLGELDALARAHGLPTAAELAGEDLIVDVGCGVARSTLELAAAGPARALGLDANWPLLRIAAGVLTDGVARFPVRRTGLVFDDIVRPFDHPGRERADVWCADAHAIPLPDASVSLVVAVNVLDCLHDPVVGLGEIARILRPGGVLQLATPFDWSPTATSPGSWIGGHSPLGQGAGDPATLLAALLTPGGHAQSIDGLELIATADPLDWSVRVHDRAVMHYRAMGLVARRTG